MWLLLELAFAYRIVNKFQDFQKYRLPFLRYILVRSKRKFLLPNHLHSPEDKWAQYYHWHIDSGSHEFSYRQLVAIFYLNDLKKNQGGTTEFFHQDVIITPKAGKLILFPPFWTHKHRGAEVIFGKKYIATTWVVFA